MPKTYRRWLSDQVRSEKARIRKAAAILIGQRSSSKYLAHYWLGKLAIDGITADVRQAAIVAMLNPASLVAQAERDSATGKRPVSRNAAKAKSRKPPKISEGVDNSNAMQRGATPGGGAGWQPPKAS